MSTAAGVRTGRLPTPALAPTLHRIGPVRRVARGVGRFGILFAIFVLVYALVAVALRPWNSSWGATGDEASRPLPGDELVANPQGQSTLAVTVRAPAERVYPWLLQLGQGRGGLYTYDFLENLLGLDIHSAGRIIPEYQRPQVGEPVRYGRPGHPAGSISPRYAAFDPNRAVLLLTPDDRSSRAFVLVPQADGSTRLLYRTRAGAYASPVTRLIFGEPFEPLIFVLSRKMLLGIQARAEGAPPTPAADVVEVLLRMVASVAFFLAGFGALSRPGRGRYAAAGAALAVVGALLIGRPPLWLGAMAALAIVAAMVWAYRPALLRGGIVRDRPARPAAV